MLLLNHLHCSHFIIYARLLLHRIHCYWIITTTAITSSHITSHTLLLNHHKHCYYFITYYFTTYTALTSSHALLSLPHVRCSYFITYTTPTSSQAMLVLHHMHCSYSNACTALASSQALLFHHMRCYHCFTWAVWPAGIEPRTTDLDFFFDAKRKRKKGSDRGPPRLV